MQEEGYTTHCYRCRGCRTLRGSSPVLGIALVFVGLFLVHQVAAMSLQHGVAGDPAPGRSPGPPLRLTTSKTAVISVRHHPEMTLTQDSLSNRDDEENEFVRLGERVDDESSSPEDGQYRQNGRKYPDPDMTDEGYTVAENRHSSIDSIDVVDVVDDLTTSWQEDLSEEGSVSLPPAEEEQEEDNETDSWCANLDTDEEVLQPEGDIGTNFTVKHPTFSTNSGLVRGVTYQVSILIGVEVENEILVTSHVDGRTDGVFVSFWDDDDEGPCSGAEWAAVTSDPSTVFNWSIPFSPGDARNSSVSFRLRFRTQSGKATIYQLQLTFPLLKDCELTLWPSLGNVSWLDVPRDSRDCLLYFPTPSERRGIVIELTRLNIPCGIGGFLQFNSSRMCGKLEELPPSGRRLYYPSPPTPPARLHGNPIFAFSYRLVHYCYNVTLTARNDTLSLRPTSGLTCTFRIHLPYGYRVSMRLQTGVESNQIPTTEDPEQRNTNLPEEDGNLPAQRSISQEQECPGLMTWLWDGTSTWTHCARGGEPRRDVRVMSRGNSVTLRVEVGPGGGVAMLRLWYRAEPVPDVVQQCPYGWVTIRQFCVSAIEDMRLTWHEAEEECVRRGGHLASIRSEQSQAVVDNLLINSPGYREYNSYWIGASDKTYEGDFRWSDGLPFSYTNWFPGWAQHRHHNRQPNDDGLSEQDCVELRRLFHLPSGSERLAHSFMWNDRDCDTHNFFICERLHKDVKVTEVWSPECNRSMTLSREQPRATLVSPGFPHQYPDNAQCDTEILALPGYRLVLDFEELVLEKEPSCSYDYLQIIEGTETRKFCGDWSTRLKLLRYASRGPRLLLRFVSDYSHHYGGFKAKVSMENGMECEDDRLQMFNGSCYLFVSYPEVTWQTAKQICQGMKAELASIHSAEEENFITAHIRDSPEYSTSAIYWLGGQLVPKSLDHWEWIDGSPLTFTAWLSSQMAADSEMSDSSIYSSACLGIQWMPSPSPTLPSGLYWQAHRCNAVGGYVCKRGNQGSGLQLNSTVNGTVGFLTSPNFPGNYYHNLDYWVQLIGPERTRLVIQFKQLDLESQSECLYDFVELRSVKEEHDDAVRWCGSHHSEMDRFNFVSKSNRAFLRFHSDYSIAGSGFSATWHAVDISGCPTQILTAREGSLTSPNYPNFLMAHLDCSTTILAPMGRRIWLEFLDYDLGSSYEDSGSDGFHSFKEAILELDLEGGSKPFRPFQVPTHLTDGAYLSAGERLHVRLQTADKPRGIGFKAVYKTVSEAHEERVLDLRNVTVGTLLHLNYPKPAPSHVDFVQHLIAPLGHTILLELYHMTLSENNGCANRMGTIEVTDNYADTNGTWWYLCEATQPADSSTVAIVSYFNTLYLRQKSSTHGVRLNATVRVNPDSSYRLKLVRGSEDGNVETCFPNPCLHGGKCVSNGSQKSCQCSGHFTGMFCALTLCELQPCVFGECNLTPTSYTCTCMPSYTGTNCEQKLKPCADNPCEGRGECLERGDNFHCRCHAWWEGQRCERRMMHIPFKPLSERMLQEPFWLGLITVTVVLGVIGLVWCAKRHFPEKLEKLLAEEADRNRPGCSSHSRPPSVREQLAATGSATVVVVPSPQPGCPRSLFGRLGIRKPSLLSLTSPHGHNHPTAASATARTFSLDDLLKPPPRRTPSPRKKRNNSTPTKKNIAEKKQILQQLITPSANQQNPRKVSLGELIQLSERRAKENDKAKKEDGVGDGEETETTFTTAVSDANSTTALSSIDAKLEKKVTFARLLSKVSAEMSSGSELESNNTRHPQLSGLPRSSSTPPSPAADIRSPHSTSSNQGSDSMSSLDASLPFGGSAGQTVTEFLNSRRPNRLLQNGRPLKNTSADSILAMFRNFSSATAGPSSSHKISPSTTPTASSPQDDAAGSDESSTSSAPTPMSSSSFTLESPTLHRHNQGNTIEVPVLDALSAHKAPSSSSGNFLNPPTILLEIPSGGISKCLSPIREVPTPLATPSPSPSLTPIMPRSAPLFLRTRDEDNVRMDMEAAASKLEVPLPSIKVTNSSDEDDEEESESDNDEGEISIIVPKRDSNPEPGEREVITTQSNQSPLPFRLKVRPPPFTKSSRTVAVSEENVPNSGEEEVGSDCNKSDSACPTSSASSVQTVIPLLTIQQPSPTHQCPPRPLLGSPPPQRAGNHLESNFQFTAKGPRRLLKELDKPNSLDLPCPPPLITVTTNMSEAESDTESISPATKTGNAHPGVSGGGVGMCYLSPFSMCSRADRTASESNLSSSGYSSMASPGPSRCGSNNPLCPSEVDDPPCPGSGCGPGHLPTRKPSPLLRTPATTTDTGGNEGEARRPPEDHVLQGGHCRGRSDSETMSDDLFMESNDEGIGTDHLDEKIEEGELKSAKELEVFIGKELLENGKTLLGLPMLSAPPIAPPRGITKYGSVDTGLDCCKLLPPSTVAQCSKSSLQLPAIVVQPDPGGSDKHLSPVSSRSESPLSDKTAGLGRFSPLFYGRHKSDQLPFTDSDGLYDCPSSDCPQNRAPASTIVQQHRKSTGRRRERRSAPRIPGTCGAGGGNKTPSPTKTSTFLDVPGKDQFYRPVAPRKPSPKRTRARTQPRVSSSSSSESLTSTREMTIRSPSDKNLNTWTGLLSSKTDVDWGSETKRHLSVEVSAEDTGEEVTSQMLPKLLPREDMMPKSHRKVSRLRTIGHQIRFLRRLELSLKRRETLVSPSESVDSCEEEEDDEGCSPPSMSPLLGRHYRQKSSSYGHLQQDRSRKQTAVAAQQLLIPPEERLWQQVRVTGTSGHTD